MALNMVSVQASLEVANATGLVVDLRQLAGSIDRLEAACDDAEGYLHDAGLTKPNSWKQAQGWLAARGHTSIPNTRSETLFRQGIVEKDEGAAQLVKYRSALAQARAAGDIYRRAEVHGAHGIVRCQWSESVTGRVYTAKPNLQGAPLPVREATHARKGHFFLLVDWSAAELFAIAALAEEWDLVRFMASGGDSHQYTADLLGIERELGKVVNLGLVYGMTARGMQEQTGLHLGLCEEYLEQWFEVHPRIRDYREWLIKRARRTGEVEISPELRIPIAKEKWEKNPQEAERAVVAYVGQGQIAALMRKAVAVKELRRYLRLPYHDGALYELPDAKVSYPQIAAIAVAWTRTINGHGLKVVMTRGKTWAEAKGE